MRKPTKSDINNISSDNHNVVVVPLRVPLGTYIPGVPKGSNLDESYHIINRRDDPDILIPYSVSPSDIASSLTYRELSDKLLYKYGMKSSINHNGNIEFR